MDWKKLIEPCRAERSRELTEEEIKVEEKHCKEWLESLNKR